MVWLIVAVIIILLIALFVVMGKYKQTGKKGNMLERVFRKYPRYHNRNNHTMGRIDGAHGIDPINKNYARIRYKKGLLNHEVDENVPVWAIKEINPPDTTIPEGLVEVEPYDPNVRWADNSEKLLIEVHQLTESKKALINLITKLSAQIRDGANLTIVQDNLKNMGKLANTITKNLEGAREATEQVPTIKLEEKAKERKATTV